MKDTQRRAMFAKLNRNYKPLKSMSYNELVRHGVYLHPHKDSDRDGLKNNLDCKPLNQNRKGIIHDAISGIGRIGGYVVGEASSGMRDIPKAYETQKRKTIEKEKIIEEGRAQDIAMEVERLRLKLERKRESELKKLAAETKDTLKFVKVTFSNGRVMYTPHLKQLQKEAKIAGVAIVKVEPI